MIWPAIALGALGLTKGIIDTKEKRKEAENSRIKGVADAWTGKDWSMKNVSPWQYLTNPLMNAGQGALVGYAASPGSASAAGPLDGMIGEAPMNSYDYSNMRNPWSVG